MAAMAATAAVATALSATALSAAAAGPEASASASATVDPGPVPRAVCGPGSNPETGRQGRVPAEEIENGRAAQGYRCNTELVGQYPPAGTAGTGGFKVLRYVDEAGHECAFYDTALIAPLNAATARERLTGVYVLDMTDPARPVRTATLLSPAMQSPHESLALSMRRGLLVAVMGNPFFLPGQVEVYDVRRDCRTPSLLSSFPAGLLGHESGFAPDGLTYYAASLWSGTLTAVDLADPSNPRTVWVGAYNSHGLSISEDGTRAYLAAKPGLVILDTSEVQHRKSNPSVRVISTLTWDTVSTPQVTIPVTISGHPYVIEMDEYASGDNVGAARVIDIADETSPVVIANIRLEVNMAANRASQAGDPGLSTDRYTGHYCEVPTRVDPGVLACTFIQSGLRLIDIRDPHHPKEVAYFNAPGGGFATSPCSPTGTCAMSSVAFVPERSELWYSDGNRGFYVVRVTNGGWPRQPEANPAVAGGTMDEVPARRGPSKDRPGDLPATGGRDQHRDRWAAGLAVAAMVAVLVRRASSRPR